MSGRRRMMLLLLVPLIGVLFLGGIGEIELLIWLVLLAGWLYGFFGWARRIPSSRS